MHDTSCCDKLSPHAVEHTAGIMPICCRHGFVYGLFSMQRHEGPTMLFETLRERFDTEQLRIVVYDNACHVVNSSVLRDPRVLRYTWLLLDRFHGSNHSTCNLEYLAWPSFGGTCRLCATSTRLARSSSTRG